jgi:hypothetical protein
MSKDMSPFFIVIPVFLVGTFILGLISLSRDLKSAKVEPATEIIAPAPSVERLERAIPDPRDMSRSFSDSDLLYSTQEDPTTPQLIPGFWLGNEPKSLVGESGMSYFYRPLRDGWTGAGQFRRSQLEFSVPGAFIQMVQYSRCPIGHSIPNDERDLLPHASLTIDDFRHTLEITSPTQIAGASMRGAIETACVDLSPWNQERLRKEAADAPAMALAAR